VRTLKAIATSAALILAALTAHILAGGEPLSFYSALSLVGALLLIALFISPKTSRTLLPEVDPAMKTRWWQATLYLRLQATTS
jgi:hypothetical protein